MNQIVIVFTAVVLFLSTLANVGQAAPLKKTDGKKVFTLEVNIGPVDFSQYSSGQGRTLAGCTGATYRGCFIEMLKNYAKQGVTGIRFMIDLNSLSGPFKSDGTVSPAWLTQFGIALSDLKDSGIPNITPNFSWAGWGNGQVLKVHDDCKNQDREFRFYRATPFAFEVANDRPYDDVDNASYKCSPANPIFIGWSNIYRAFDQMLGQIQTAGLNVNEFDIVNEMNILWFPIMARYIYDTAHGSTGDLNVYGTVRKLMSKHGFDADRTTYSLVVSTVSSSGFDCLSAYGDSARLIAASAFTNAVQGKPFGHAINWNVQNGLLCGGTFGSDMPTLKTAQPLPNILDIHIYSCVTGPNGCDTSANDKIMDESVAMFDSIQDLLETHYSASTPFMLGETHSALYSGGNACDENGSPTNAASQEVAGLLWSRLSSGTRSADSNIVRPWNNTASMGGCYNYMHQVNPPYVNLSTKTPSGPLPVPVISVTYSYPVPSKSGDISVYAVLKGSHFDSARKNTVVSSCSNAEISYDGADGASIPGMAQINVKVPAKAGNFPCTFQVKKADGSLSSPVSLMMQGN